MSIQKMIEVVVGSVDDKRRYRQYTVRVKALPEGYRTAVQAIERYLGYAGGIVKGDALVAMLEDLVDLFEQSAAAGTPVRAVVGEDPVEFVDEFLRNYADGQWISRERDRLISSIKQAADQDAPDSRASR